MIKGGMSRQDAYLGPREIGLSDDSGLSFICTFSSYFATGGIRIGDSNSVETEDSGSTLMG